jgi:hypothetical protein
MIPLASIAIAPVSGVYCNICSSASCTEMQVKDHWTDYAKTNRIIFSPIPVAKMPALSPAYVPHPNKGASPRETYDLFSPLLTGPPVRYLCSI